MIQHLFVQPFRIFRNFIGFSNLIALLTQRDVRARYKGSLIGFGWTILQPLVMLCIYTFVFSTILKARWGVEANESSLDFALALFTGLVTYGIFSEVANAAPYLILTEVNYVKKVVFPLEILPLVSFLGTMVSTLFSLLVLFVGVLLIKGTIFWTWFLLPIVWIPMFGFSLGGSYFLSSTGVFIRDMAPTVQLATTILFFLSPIVYPASAVPESLRWIYQLNPIAVCVENARRVVLWGMTPDWGTLAAAAALSGLCLVLGYGWFAKTRKGFADVV